MSVRGGVPPAGDIGDKPMRHKEENHDRYSVRTMALHVKAEDVEEDGSFSGLGSVFGVVDSYNEAVAAGAFKDSLAEHMKKGRMPRMLWQHNSDQPIGVWDEISEDKNGLVVKGRLAIDENPNEEVRQAREAYKLLRMGALDGLSIGYKLRKSETDEDTGVRTLLSIDLWEVSLVTFPANDDARIGAVRSVRDLEIVLRDAGLSKKEAVAVASHGYKGLVQRDAVPEPQVDAEKFAESM